MKQLKLYTIIGILFVLIIGSIAHFLYEWTGNNTIIGLFVPVTESVWEHMKLLFFPMLLYFFILFIPLKKTYPCAVSSFCFGILLGTFLIPIFFYIYTAIIGQSILFIDIGIFVLSTILSFYAMYQFTQSCKLKPYTFWLCSLVLFLLICFVVFTYHPPESALFADPTNTS